MVPPLLRLSPPPSAMPTYLSPIRPLVKTDAIASESTSIPLCSAHRDVRTILFVVR